jgi:hypothetical protein
MTQVRAFAKYAPAETRHTANNLGLALTVASSGRLNRV